MNNSGRNKQENLMENFFEKKSQCDIQISLFDDEDVDENNLSQCSEESSEEGGVEQ